MKAVNAKAHQVLTYVFKGLEVGAEQSFDAKPRTYQSLAVIRRDVQVFHMNHWLEVNGDLCEDPGMTFWWGLDRKFYPVDIVQTVGVQLPPQISVELGGDGQPARIKPESQRELVAFANMWCANINEQQILPLAERGALLHGKETSEG